MVGQGVGVVPALREVAKRFAQRAVLDLLDGHLREFAIDAGTTIEFLAKSLVAGEDPTALFEIRKGELALGWREQAVLDPRLQDAARRRLLADEVQEARRDLAQRRTISARQAIEIAFELWEIDDERLATAATRLRERRDACVHFGDEPLGDIGDAADEFVLLAERLWGELRRPRTELWGWASPVAEVSVLGRRDSFELDARMRVARSQYALAAAGVIGAARRRRLADGQPNAHCPSCRGPAFVHREPPGSGPAHLSNGRQDAGPVVVLDCLTCGLSLWDGQIEMYGGFPDDWPS